MLRDGRVPDIAALRLLFVTHRLTTVTGPPGPGRSEAAVAAATQAAYSFPDGMRRVVLGDLCDKALLAHAVMRAAGVPDRLTLPQAEALCDGLRESRLLLVLDGCDDLARDCAALVQRLLRHCPRLHIGATSTEPLGIDQERVFPVLPGPVLRHEVRG